MVLLKLLYYTIVIVSLVSISCAWIPLEFIERQDWGLDPTPPFLEIEMPLIPEYVVISDTNTDGCTSKELCTLILNYVINFQSLQEPPSAISAHFYVGGDGRIYVGRGWDAIGEKNYGCEYSKPIIDITFIGNFRNSKLLPQRQLQAAQKLLEYGIMNQKLSDSYELFGEWQLIKRHPPAKSSNVRSMRTWAHWTANATICSDGFDNHIPPVEDTFAPNTVHHQFNPIIY